MDEQQLCNWESHTIQGVVLRPYEDRDWHFCEVHWTAHRGEVSALYGQQNLRQLSYLWTLYLAPDVATTLGGAQ